MSSTLSPAAQAALAGAISSRGPNKGRLLRNAPKLGTDACAAWHGAMLVVNPFKSSVCSMLMMSDAQLAIVKEVQAHFDAMPKAERIAFDKDRATLEACGVW